ncbi:acetyl-CoA decarbonylase/synthase complex subunit gamma [bacterium]|nr:acetyl-CoA decarbonylase/synthase complex subunit gamma [bacterium]
MALTGLQIYKLLPQTNCKECGYPTCLAFAMKLAAKQVSLDLCPDASDEAKETLGAASVPPIRKVAVGSGDYKVEMGEEVVLFRHDKTFYHETVLALGVAVDQPEAEFLEAVKTITGAAFDRAGECIAITMIALRDKAGNSTAFAKRAKLIADHSPLPIVLVTDDPEKAQAAADKLTDGSAILYGATTETASAFVDLAKAKKMPLALQADSLEELADLAEKVAGMGFKDLILDPGFVNQAEMLKNQTLIRRIALDRKVKGFGYPTSTVIPEGTDAFQMGLLSSLGIAKYTGLIIVPEWQTWHFMPLLTMRQNIYTDPQKPLQVDGGIYEVGEPLEDSPVYVSTNFSLTYFMLSSEIDASDHPAWIVIVDAEGMSVLTAWSAGKFGGEQVGKAVLASGIGDKIKHRKVVIPGYVAVIKGEMEDAMPGWEIMVGPQEAADIPSYVKEVWLRSAS